MPLPNERKNAHKAFVSGYLSIGKQTAVYNENRRLIGREFTAEFKRVPYNTSSLTAMDLSIVGHANLSQITKKVEIPYTRKLDNASENKYLCRINDAFYNINRVEKWNESLILYLITTDEKGANVNE